MPLFDICCDRHGKQEVLSSTSDSLDCPVCGQKAERLYTKGRIKIVMDFTDGWDSGAGRYFATARERNNWVAEKGIRRIRD